MTMDAYVTDEASGDGWRLMLGDTCERIAEIDPESVDLSVFSPPFASLYTYSPSPRDLGNSFDRDEFLEHFGFVIRGLLAATKPGRNAAVHVQQLTTSKATHGQLGMTDFRGQVIQAFQDGGWIYYGDITIDKNPQAQAIRTKSVSLMFVTLDRDAAVLRPALADYLIVFKKPGENKVPIKTDVSREEWIKWAHPIWDDINETDTLNVRVAREDADERHICPLQLPLIERCVRLWSNPGELVFSPFAGIGSEGYVSVKQGRKFIGIELKPSYWKTACDNLNMATAQLTMV